MDKNQDNLGIKKDGIVNVELSNKALDEFLNLYKNMADGLSHTHFDKFLEILRNENMTFSKEETVDLFRANLLEQLTESFQKMWNIQQIPQSISVLELLKERFKNRTIPQWRPQGKSVAEQTLPNRIRLLQKKREFIIKQWDFQKSSLEAAVVEISTNRKRIEKLIRRREVLSYRIDEQSEKLQVVQEKILKAELDAIKLL